MSLVIHRIGIISLIVGSFLLGSYLQKKRYEKQFEQISDHLEKIALKEQQIEENEKLQDTLLSKIFHQLYRLRTIQMEALKKMQLQQENTQTLITEIAHQLRNPLMNIQTYLELLSDSALREEEKKKYMWAISNATDKLTFLVESFIKVSRLENDLIQLRLYATDLKETVLCSIFQNRTKAKEKDITIEIKEESKIKIAHDTNWLSEAISNLLDNSIKYSPMHAKIVVTIRQNEMSTEIMIEDQGIGIGPQEEAKIFQKFYRGERVTTEEGFGIGLYLSRKIVEAHGGIIKVKRRKQGLQVSILLF